MRQQCCGTLVVNTVQISTDGLPPLRNTEQQRSEYSRGEGGEDAEGGPLWSPVPVHHRSTFLLFDGIAHKGPHTTPHHPCPYAIPDRVYSAVQIPTPERQ